MAMLGQDGDWDIARRVGGGGEDQNPRMVPSPTARYLPSAPKERQLADLTRSRAVHVLDVGESSHSAASGPAAIAVSRSDVPLRFCASSVAFLRLGDCTEAARGPRGTASGRARKNRWDIVRSSLTDTTTAMPPAVYAITLDDGVEPKPSGVDAVAPTMWFNDRRHRSGSAVPYDGARPLSGLIRNGELDGVVLVPMVIGPPFVIATGGRDLAAVGSMRKWTGMPPIWPGVDHSSAPRASATG